MSDIDTFVGKTVTISGRIVITGVRQAFLTSGVGAFKRQESLLIRDGARIADHLLHSLPVYVGGRFIYDDDCILTGTIEQDADSFIVCDLRECKVRRDEWEVEVPVSG